MLGHVLIRVASINYMTCYLSFPAYFKTKTSEELLDLRKTAYACAYREEGKTFYEVLLSSPERFNTFNKAMMQQEASMPTLGMFPFTSLKEEVIAESERAFIVDIGGGRGQSLLLINQETSNAFGTGAKTILQDRPQVLDTIPQESLPGIEKMPYDFYTEQPIKSTTHPSYPTCYSFQAAPTNTPTRCTHLFSPTYPSQLPRWPLSLNPQKYRLSYVFEIASPNRRDCRPCPDRSRRGYADLLDGYGDAWYWREGKK